jgi:hypothetical protein
LRGDGGLCWDRKEKRKSPREMREGLAPEERGEGEEKGKKREKWEAGHGAEEREGKGKKGKKGRKRKEER